MMQLSRWKIIVVIATVLFGLLFLPARVLHQTLHEQLTPGFQVDHAALIVAD